MRSCSARRACPDAGKRSFVLISVALALVIAASAQTLEQFVLIKGNISSQKSRGPRVEDFEILEHPVCNREYKLFLDATGYPSVYDRALSKR